jgi:putative transcriptional regulator
MIINIEKLKGLRKEKKFTQENISKMANITQNYFSAIETGKCTPALDTTITIARTLGVTVNDLLVDDTPNPPQPPPSETTPEAEGAQAEPAA